MFEQVGTQCLERYTVTTACASLPKKFNLVHQTDFPCERVGSGDKIEIERYTCNYYLVHSTRYPCWKGRRGLVI